MVNSTGSNNETDLSLKCPEDGKRHATGTAAHQLEDDECDIIGTLIGDYGRWQFLMTLLLALFQIPNTFHIYSPTFQVSAPSITHFSPLKHFFFKQAADRLYWCKRPERFANLSVETWRNYSHSENNCQMLNVNWNNAVDVQQASRKSITLKCT